MIKPIIFQLPSTKVDLINESKIIYSKSDIIAQPLFKYGFHYYINQSKDKLSLLNNDNLRGKTFYNVIENFDDNIPNYDETISIISKKELKTELNRYKFQLYEILFIFGLNGNIYCNDEDYDSVINSFNSKYQMKYKILEDVKKCDVYININSPNVDIKQKEQNQYFSILESIVEISDNLNKGGNCVIKIFDSFSEVTVKLLKLISEMFEETYIYKSYLSYGRESDKFIIGLKFKANYKNSDRLKDIISEMKSNKLNNIWNEYIIPKDFEFVIKYMNIVLGNYEHKMINLLIDYINKSNYFGDIYHSSIETQKINSKLWIDIFFSNNYKKSKDNLNSLINDVIKENNNNMKQMFSIMI